jgi:long-chain fatty acid transport protein
MPLSSGDAWAGGATLYDDGSPDSGHAIAGRFALAADACTAIHNPAGMTRLTGNQILLGVQPILASAEFQVGSSTSPGLGKEDGGDAGGLSPVATFCYARSIGGNDDLKVGIGVGGLAGGAFDFDEDWVGRYYLTELEFSAAAAAGSVGYRVSDKVSIGGSLIIGNGVFKQKAAINNVADSISDGELEIDDTVFGFAGGLGLLIEPTDRTRFGIIYTTELDLDFEDVLTTRDVGPGLKSVIKLAGLRGSELDLGLTLPQKAFFSWYHDVSDRLALMGNVGWEDYSEFGLVDVSIVNDTATDVTTDLLFDDTEHVAFGARLRIGEPWVFSTGIAYDSSPVAVENRSPVLPLDRQARIGFGLERERESGNIWALTLSYVDLGNARFDVERGPLAGRVQGKFDTNAVLVTGFSWQWR